MRREIAFFLVMSVFTATLTLTVLSYQPFFGDGITIEQKQAQAQEAGLLELLVRLFWPLVWSAILSGLIKLFLVNPFTWFWNTFFGGTPAVGPDSQTDKDANTAIASNDKQIELWGAFAKGMEAWQFPISGQYWWLYEEAMQSACDRMEQLCPGVGEDLCTAYAWAIIYNNRTVIKRLDFLYPACGGIEF